LNLQKLLLLLMLVGCLQGCAYSQKRYNDVKDMIDLGLTFSSKPEFAFYGSGPVLQAVATVGYGDVDGHYFGLGEGNGHLWSPHYEKSYGLLVWGQEWVSFDHDQAAIEALPKDEAETVSNHMQVGVVGFARGWAGAGAPPPGRKYIVSCPHYFHFGWVGLVITPRWLQMADFVLGWTTLDICQDDDARLADKPAAAVEEKK
jgi:hypothetical protein